MKFILVSGGTISGLGKGVITSSLGLLLQNNGFKINIVKIDPYLNIDAGTMNPNEHGEVYVLKDGTETDLDLGNYERYLNISLTKENSITTGRIYKEIIEDEREGKYLGKTVQVIPHVIDKIIDKLIKLTINTDILLIELGGTVGDIESLHFIESLRQLRFKVTRENFIHIHLTLIIKNDGEQKTKPAQNSIKEIRSLGLEPDIVIGRSIDPLQEETINKLSIFSQLPKHYIITCHNTTNLYEVPIMLDEQKLSSIIINKFNLTSTNLDNKILNLKKIYINRSFNKIINIGIISKYIKNKDTYLSIVKSLEHASYHNDIGLNIHFIDCEKDNIVNNLKNINGIIIPGGFGNRGIEGKILAIKYARENNIPFLGICLGFQLAIIEYARNILGIKNAVSEEFDNEGEKLIIFMSNIKKEIFGGNMNLGDKSTFIQANTLAYDIYKKTIIIERHRHRYEFNTNYMELFKNSDIHFSGKYIDQDKFTILEHKNHPFFIATQFHPEFNSSLFNPSSLFLAFTKKCINTFYNIK